MEEIRDYVRKSREEEVNNQITEIIRELDSEGYRVQFGNIGLKTTYALIFNDDHSIEYVGYTFIKNIKYYNENIGRLKALEQAIARKETLGA